MDWSKHLNALKCSFQLELPISKGNIDLGGILLQLGLEAICSMLQSSFMLDFSVLDYLNSLRFPLTRETDTKKLSSFSKLQFLNDKVEQNTNFA